MGTRQASPELCPALRTGWDFAERVRAELLEAVGQLTSAQWTFRSAPSSWCIGEVVDHLLRAEIGSSKMARKLIRGDFRSQEVPPGAILHTSDLDHYPYGSLEAPQELTPGPVRERSVLEQELAAAHGRFRSELEQFCADDPEALRSPDPATGVWFTLGGWLKLQAWHEAHHIAQIRRILAATDFPR